MTLLDVLERSRALGFLGPGPVADHVDHALRFEAGLPDGPIRFADLGAGGGVPTLPLLQAGGDRRSVMIDASQKRCSFLQWAVVELGLTDRAEVWCGRAEQIGHEDRARHRFDAVVARGFGPPAMTVECGAALLSPGGVLVISEPPVPRRWPSETLAGIGLGPAEHHPGVVIFRRTGDGPADHPRPAKRLKRDPLFSFE